MLRSCASLFAGTVTGAAAETAVAVPCGNAGFAGELAAGPAVAGALCAGRFGRGGTISGFGAKKRAHSRITPIDSSDATKIRSSGVRFFFFCGSLTNGPRLH